ncbi:MAG TPA: Ig-like domain-containing protein, partial [Gemmatimonadaceae bacterium]
MRPLRFLRYLAFVAATSCTDTVAPKPVASLSISGALDALVPGQTVKLSATPRDAAGLPLQRAVTWASSDAAVATVAAGLVTANQLGSVTITATSENAAASVAIAVDDGGMLNPAGAVVQASSGDLRIVAVAGAVLQPIAVIVKQTDHHPGGSRFFTRSAYEIMIPAAGVAQPLTLTVRYNPADLRGTPEDAVRLMVVAGDKWQRLEGNSVDTTQHIVSARISSGGVFAPLLQAPIAAIAVDPATTSIRVHDVVHVTARLTDQDGEPATGRKVNWSSSNLAVLAVDSLTGDATAVSPGTANVTATSEDQ